MTLHVGSRSTAVARLNARLRALGYATSAGASFGEPTRHAVMAFQKVNGLERDGVAGARTLRALRAPVPVAIGRGAGDRVVIDLSDQVLLLVRGGRVRTIVNASTGTPDLADGRGEATPVGTYRVGRKVRAVEHGPLGPMWWPSYFHGGIAVHGSPSVPAGPASHGCVRIPLHLAQSVSDAMRAGMTVQVRR